MSTKTNQNSLPIHLEDKISKEFQRLNNERLVKSSLLMVESLDGDFKWFGAKGINASDERTITPETPFWIASTTKLFIAAAILKLHEQKKISIYEPMMAYLPKDLVQGLHWQPDGTDHTEKITLYHLLSHTSGIPDFLEDHPKGETSLMEQIFEGDDQTFSIEEAVKLVKNRLPAHFPPQEMGAEKKKVRYSDTNFQLLIAIIEKMTGKSLHDAFDQLFYQPLGLKSTFHPGNKPDPSLPDPMQVWNGEKTLDLPKAMGSFGDLNSTASDLIQFIKSLLQGTAFDDPQTGEMMRSGFNHFDFSLSPSPKSPGWPIEYGLGMMRFKIPGIFTLFRPTPSIIGHTGVSGAWLFYSPELQLFFTGTINQVAAPALPFKLLQHLLTSLR